MQETQNSKKKNTKKSTHMYNDTHTTHVRAAEGTEHAVFRERDAA